MIEVRYEGKGEVAYQTIGSSGFDAYVQENVVLEPKQKAKLGTGLYIVHAIEDLEFGEGRVRVRPELQVRPRSSAFWNDWLVAFGTVDLDYRGQILVVVRNESNETRKLLEGDRLAQIVGTLTFLVSGVPVREAVRGDGGFGSTGGTR